MLRPIHARTALSAFHEWLAMNSQTAIGENTTFTALQLWPADSLCRWLRQYAFVLLDAIIQPVQEGISAREIEIEAATR